MATTHRKTLAKQLRTLLNRIRGDAGIAAYGRSPLLGDIQSLRERARFRVEPDVVDLSGPMLLGFEEPDGRRTLQLRAGLTLPVRRFLEFYQAAWAFASHKPTWEDAALATGLAGVLNLQESLLNGPGWRSSVVDEIAALDPVWGATDLLYLADVAQSALLSEVQPPSTIPRDSEAIRYLDKARSARKAGDRGLAEELFGIAGRTASASGDFASVALSLMGRAHIQKKLRRFDEAESLIRKALRVAEENACVEEAAKAKHFLFLVAADRRSRNTNELAARAFRAYDELRHPELAVLAFDIAHYWTDSGDYACALALLRAVLPRVQDARVRLLIWAHIAATAGGVKDSAIYRMAVGEIERLTRDARAADAVAPAFTYAARGAALLGRQMDAIDYARRGESAASARGDLEDMYDARVEMEKVMTGAAGIARARLSRNRMNLAEAVAASLGHVSVI